MILAIDVDYSENEAFVAIVEFSKLQDSIPGKTYTTRIKGIVDYEPGSFYKKLPN